MSKLLELIHRKKRFDSGANATDTVATLATHSKPSPPATVAKVATVAVAPSRTQKTADDDRITCRDCSQLVGRQCRAALRREIVGAGTRYEPIDDLPRRCEGFRPLLTATDTRTGAERWPSLLLH